jgi:hypothetical protein
MSAQRKMESSQSFPGATFNKWTNTAAAAYMVFKSESACNFLSSCDGSNAMFGSRQMLPSKLCLGILSKNSSSDFALPSVTVVHTQHKWSANGFMESHSTLNYFSDSAFWHVPLDFKKMEEERGVEII